MKPSVAVRTAIGLAAPLSAASPANSANDGKIEYTWDTGNSLARTFENHSKTIDRKRMNSVKNLKCPNVKFYLDGAANVTLGNDQRNPVAGNNLTSVKLTKAKCLNGPGESASSKGALKTEKLPKCKPKTDGPIEVNRVPVTGGDLPGPYPNVDCED
jgi:hypothetical protein